MANDSESRATDAQPSVAISLPDENLLRRWAFARYQAELSANTIDRHRHDLASFRTYLEGIGYPLAASVPDTPEAWRGITFPIVEGFRLWLLNYGYAIRTVNVRLATIRTYAMLCFQAGIVSQQQYALINTVRGYSERRGINVDEKRARKRVGKKKPAPTELTVAQRQRLKHEHDATPQGIRDRLIMCLLLDHGLRVSELAGLKARDVDTEEWKFTFYRHKVNKTQTHTLTPNAREALRDYIPYMPRGERDPLLRASLKSGELDYEGMTRGAIYQRVRLIGDRIGIALSAHDCRHSWATQFKESHDILELQEAGGWTSIAMPSLYVRQGAISNDGKPID